MNKNKVVFGVDLGTTNSGGAALDSTGMAVPTKSKEGNQTTPSIVCFLNDGEIIVGEEAKNAAAAYPEQTIREVKRQMGVMGPDGKPIPCFVAKSGKIWVAEEISALIIKKVVGDALESRNVEIELLVVTVPAYFNEVERQATLNAAQIAGFKNVKIFNEPTAAALYYAVTHPQQGLVRYLIYDLGGGTFDVSIVEVENGETRVIGTDGVRLLGGTDWDLRIVDRFRKEAAKQGVDLDKMNDPALSHELKDRVERLKHSLSARNEATLSINISSKQVSFVYTRPEFEAETRDLLEQTGEKVKNLLAAKNLSPAQIDGIVLVGGSSKMPQVRAYIPSLMGKEPLVDCDPDCIVAMGAAMAAGKMAQASGKVVYTLDERRVPTLPGGEFTNVTAHALGCAAKDTSGKKVFVPIIRKNTALPVSAVQRFGLDQPSQTIADVMVYQGDDADPLDKCLHIDTVRLSGLPAGDPHDDRIEVRYEYDESAIIKVTVTDRVSGKVQKADVAHKHGLNKSEVDEAAKNLGGG